MSSAQKSIKYIATLFAIFLIISIFTGIVTIFSGLISGISMIDNSTVSKINHTSHITYIDINIKYSNLKIIEGKTLKVKNNNNKIKVKLSNNKLLITDKNSVFSQNKDKKLIIYIPKDTKFDDVFIKVGFGKINIDGFKTKKLVLDLGAGKSVIRNISSDKTDIKVGAGKFEINNSILNDAKLNLGLGSVKINSDITGDSKINCGVGNVKLNLKNSIDQYTFKIKKGIGNVKINDEKTNNMKKNGTGSNYIIINGGVGSISIHTKK